MFFAGVNRLRVWYSYCTPLWPWEVQEEDSFSCLLLFWWQVLKPECFVEGVGENMTLLAWCNCTIYKPTTLFIFASKYKLKFSYKLLLHTSIWFHTLPLFLSHWAQSTAAFSLHFLLLIEEKLIDRQADSNRDDNKEVFVRTWGVDKQFNQCLVTLMRVRLSQGWIRQKEKKPSIFHLFG